MSTFERKSSPDPVARAAHILSALSSTTIEQAELARALGMPGDGAIEFELARIWRMLANGVGSGLIKTLDDKDSEPPW